MARGSGHVAGAKFFVEDDGCGGGGGGFDAEGVWGEVDEAGAGGASGLAFVVGEAAFGANEDADFLRARRGIWLTGGVGEEDGLSVGGRDGISKSDGFSDLHEPGTGGLFGGLGDDTGHAVELACAGIDDAVGGVHRPPCGDADLGELIDHLVEARAFGGGGAELDGGRQGGFGGAFEEGKFEVAAGGGDAGEADVTLAIDEAEGGAFAEAFDADGVSGLVASDGEGVVGRGRDGVEEDGVHWELGWSEKWRGWGQGPELP